VAKSPLLAKVTAAFSLLMSANSVASQYDFDQPFNLSYSDDCTQEYCVNDNLYTYKPSTNYALSESSDEYDFSIQQPKHFLVSEEKDWDYLMGQTYTILGLSVATVGLMTFLPESITKWDDDQRDLSKLGQKWKDNVSDGPVWDRDEHFLNYVMHPYFGGVYYTAARHAGYNEFESFVYSWTMSTFFWEYGVEAFAEVPSWQDLFITPFFGAVVGEWVGSSSGLGYLMLHANGRMQTDLMFAALLVLTIMAVSLYYLMDFCLRKSIAWQADQNLM